MLFCTTPVLLTALSGTHWLQLATLPQVLGVLAFVYAGACVKVVGLWGVGWGVWGGGGALATLPQVLGVLAFVYAGERLTVCV